MLTRSFRQLKQRIGSFVQASVNLIALQSKELSPKQFLSSLKIKTDN